MKYNFFKKRKVQVYLIITTMLLCVSACAFSSFDVKAEENNVVLISTFYGFNTSDLGITSCWNRNDYLSSSIGNNNANLDGYYYALNNNNTSIPLYLDGDESNGEYKLPRTFSINGVEHSLGEYPYFSITRVGSTDYCILYPNINFTGEGNAVWATCKIASNSSEILDFQCIMFQLNSNGSYGSPSVANTNNSWSNLYFNSYYDNYFISNAPMKTIDASKLPENYANIGGIEWWYCLVNQNYGSYVWGEYDYLIDANYQILNYSNPILSGSSGYSEQDILDNNYITEGSTILMDASSFSNGEFKFFINWNENQLADLSDFRLDYTFEIVGNVTFEGSEDYADICADYYGLTKNADGVYIIDKTFTYSGTDIGSYNGYYAVKLENIDEEFKDTNNKNAFAFEQLCDKNKGTDSVRSGTANLVSDLFNSTVLGFRIPIFQPHDEISYNTLIYTASVDIVRISTNESILKAPLYRSFNLLTGASSDMVDMGSTQETVDNTVTANGGNTAGYQGTIEVSNGGSGGSASSNNTNSGNNNNSSIESGAIVINNNPTFNNNTGGSSGSTSESSLGSWSITTLLIKYIAGGKNSGVSYIEDLAGTNTFLNIVTSYMSFVPAEIWSLVITTFTVTLGCVVVAFIISIVIKIIT